MWKTGHSARGDLWLTHITHTEHGLDMVGLPETLHVSLFFLHFFRLPRMRVSSKRSPTSTPPFHSLRPTQRIRVAAHFILLQTSFTFPWTHTCIHVILYCHFFFDSRRMLTLC